MCRFIILLGSNSHLFFGGDSNERKRKNGNFKGSVVKVPIFMQISNLKRRKKLIKIRKIFYFYRILFLLQWTSNFDSIVLQFKREKRVVNREIYWAIAWKCYRSIIINLNLNCKCIEIMMIIHENSELFQCTRNRSPKWDRIFNIVFRCLSRHITSRHVIPAS